VSTGDAPAEGWAARLERLDAGWQRIEAVLCTAVLAAEILSLTLWVSLRGLSTDYVHGANSSGLVYRSIVTGALFGIAAHRATRPGNRASAALSQPGDEQQQRRRRIAVTAAIVLGLAAGRGWAHAGVTYASNVLNWLQNASALMLIGGLRGLVTRLTLWVALLGASLATSRGKHIRIDVVLRSVPAKLSRATAVVGQLAAAVMCALAVVGFLDYISIAAYRAPAVAPCANDPTKSCETTPREKFAVVTQHVAADLFLLGRQLSLDSKSLPKVIAGTPYDGWMTAAEWNDWLQSANWTSHFEKGAVDALRMSPSGPSTLPSYRMPQVAVPGTGEAARGLLVRELTFVFPLGLAVLAIKFLVRALLLLTGRVPADPEAALEEEDLARAR
jgi:Tripartite ATP-independent periplasmic transporters, DctQ component